MKIIIEGYSYNSELIESFLPGLNLPKHGRDNKCSSSYVGYYFDTKINDCLFFLPKVLLTDDGSDEEDGIKYDDEGNLVVAQENAPLSKILGRYYPEDIIDPDHPRNGVIVDKNDRDFIHNFSIWIYRALSVYREHNPKEYSVKNENISKLDNSGNEIHGSHLDSVLALIRFHNENRDFLLFTMRNIRRGYNKINWNKTISQTTAIRQKNGSILYMNPINRKKQVNFEEELLVIFYSILNYINKTMGFSIRFNLNFELIPIEQFENYLNGYGRSRLLQIKYKYFSDKALRLWNLCFLYFDRSWQMYSSQLTREYLLSTSFEKVFENIIDDLIGQDGIMPELKNNKDGKIIDHIYPYQSLIGNNDNNRIYYIGDSKYYKIGHEVQGSALYKQYTYAKNVIQSNLNIFLSKKHNRHHRYEKDGLPYRDELTEGYNITPNFFISATIDKDKFDYNDPLLTYHPKVNADKNDLMPHMQRHFDNRLFDRDTLWLSQYDINFLYVVALYVQDNGYAKEHFCKDARDLFRTKLIPVIESVFEFYLLIKKVNKKLMDVIDPHFRTLNGKIYHPFYDPKEDDDILILALEKDDIYLEENIKILEIVEKDFFCVPNFKLGTDFDDYIKPLQKKVFQDYFNSIVPGLLYFANK